MLLGILGYSHITSGCEVMKFTNIRFTSDIDESWSMMTKHINLHRHINTL